MPSTTSLPQTYGLSLSQDSSFIISQESYIPSITALYSKELKDAEQDFVSTVSCYGEQPSAALVAKLQVPMQEHGMQGSTMQQPPPVSIYLSHTSHMHKSTKQCEF